MSFPAFLLAATVLAGAPQAADDAGAGLPINRRPFGAESPWLSRPTVEQSLAIIPDSLLEARKMETVTLKCTVGAEGRLDGCVVGDRRPVPPETAAAALEATPFMQMKTRIRDGRDVTGWTVHVSLVFDVGGRPERTDFRIWPHLSDLIDPSGNLPDGQPPSGS